MIGKTVAHYKIVEQLGEGGMGVVYKAEDTKLHRTVALKFLSSETVATEADRERFAAEARAAASLDHPNICTVHEINEFEGRSYIVMACIEGRSLSEEIDEGPLGIDRAIDLAVQIAKGLSAAHERGIVHRDIKSANIMVTPKGDAKIMDFGIAHRSETVVPDDDVTTAGTLAYSSPEQLQGEPTDHRSDIWSFGVTLYETLTGQPPFRGDYPSAMAYSIQSEPPAPISALRPEVPAALEQIVGRALAKDTDDRYQSAADMYEDLRALQIERDPRISRVLSGVAADPRTPWYKPYLTGRVLAAAGVFLAAVYAAVSLTDWLLNRYVWSPHLTGIVALVLLSLLPSVLLIAASRSRDAGRGALSARNIGVPLNVVVAVALALAFYAGKDLGAATTTVSVTDEEGNTVQRVVPKQEFRKKTAVFFFDNETGDADLDWIHYAIPIMLQVDLYQDPFVVFRSGLEDAAVTSLKRAGYDDWHNVPVTLLQKIARELYTDYFLTGEYTVGDGGAYSVRMALHDANTGNLVAERGVTNADLFALVDDMSVMLKRDLGVPEGHIESTADLPVSDILTESKTALQKYVSRGEDFYLNHDMRAGAQAAEAAVAEDPTFALAWLTLYAAYRVDNRSEEAGEAIDKLMTYVYKLPERQQFMVRSIYYDYKGDYDRQLAVLEMLVELYPDDLDARGMLANAYAYRNEIEKSVEQLRYALEFDPYNFDLVGGMVDLLVERARFDEALEALEAYSDSQPDDPAALVKLGEVHETRGDLNAARRSYDRSLILDPANVDMLSKTGNIELKLGRFEEAEAHFEEGLRVAKTPQDRYTMYDDLADYYELRGQMEKSLEQMELAYIEAEQFMIPIQYQFLRLGSLDGYVHVGQVKRALALRDSLSALVKPPLDQLAKIGDVVLNLALKQPAEAEQPLGDLEEAVDAMQLHMMDRLVWSSKGRIAKLEGKHERAIEHFEKHLEVDPSNTRIHRRIGSCQRQLGEYDKARESIEKRLATHPMDPKAHYELALIYADTGNMSRALEHLRRALDVWGEADPEYEPAKKARDKLKEWQATTSM